MNKLTVTALLGSAALFASPALAIDLPPAVAPCAMSDIGLSSGTCAGFFAGNFASASTTDEQTAGLKLLGLIFPDAFANKIEKIEDGARVTDSFLNFDTMLYGITYIGVHWGNVPDGSGTKGGKVNNITSFYKFDAGTEGLDKLFLAFKTASNATVYVTGDVPPPPAVPEPATWALMLGGLGIVGAALRRRVTSVQFS